MSQISCDRNDQVEASNWKQVKNIRDPHPNNYSQYQHIFNHVKHKENMIRCLCANIHNYINAKGTCFDSSLARYDRVSRLQFVSKILGQYLKQNQHLRIRVFVLHKIMSHISCNQERPSGSFQPEAGREHTRLPH